MRATPRRGRRRGPPPAEGAEAQGLSLSRPPLRASPLPCAGFVPGDVGMLGKEEEEEEGGEGKGKERGFLRPQSRTVR